MQAFSSRPDVIPPSYLAELEKLQDRIPPFPDEDAYTVIGAELGVPASAVFSELTASPIAAASLGQASTALGRPLPNHGFGAVCLYSWHVHVYLAQKSLDVVARQECQIACLSRPCRPPRLNKMQMAEVLVQRRCTGAGCAMGRPSR